MIWETLKEALIFIDLDCENAENALQFIGNAMISEGYVTTDYVWALTERERKFPTGLDIHGTGVAIPHTDAAYVNQEGIAIASLKRPVDFRQMGEENTWIPVQLIFLLMVPCDKGQVDWIQRMLTIIQDTSVLERLQKAKQAGDVIQIIREKEWEL